MSVAALRESTNFSPAPRSECGSLHSDKSGEEKLTDAEILEAVTSFVKLIQTGMFCVRKS